MIFDEENECQFKGGPFDGNILSIPLEFNEWAIRRSMLTMASSIEDALPELDEMAAEMDPDTITREEEADFDDRVVAAFQRSQETYAKPPEGGVLYRRVPGQMVFEFDKDLTSAEFRNWTIANIRVPKSGEK